MFDRTTRLWPAVLCVALLSGAAKGQTPPAYAGDSTRIPEGSFQIIDPLAFENWTLDVFARKDGWVEIDFRVIPRLPIALPWMYSDAFDGKLGAPVWSRAYFTPAQIRAATRFADSLLDRVIPEEVAAKRFSRGAPHFLEMPAGNDKGSGGSLFDAFMFPLHPPRAGVPDGVSFGLGGCLGVEDVGASLAGAALLGRGVERSAQEFLTMMRALDTAAFFAGHYASSPRELHADLIEADQAACEARPRHDLLRPEYPAGGNGRTGDVHIDAVVDTAGRVDASTIKVVMSGGALFDTVAVSAAPQWRFAPALLTTAVPVAQRVRVDVHFAPKAPSAAEIGRIIEEAAAHGAGIVVVAKARKG